MADYIKREDAVKTLMHLLFETAINSCGIDDEYAEVCEDIATNRVDGYVSAIPAADVRENVYGIWMRDNDLVDGEVWCRWSCSECGYVRKRGWGYTSDGKKPRANLCENCGAVMRRADK